MIAVPTRLGDIPPGALILTGSGPRRLWHVPPDVLITTDPDGGDVVQGVLAPGVVATDLEMLMYVPTEIEALMTLTDTFGPLAPVSE